MDRKTFIIREKIIRLIRDFFSHQGFLEVETPILVKSPDTAPYNEVFETKFIKKTFNPPGGEAGSKHLTKNAKAFLTPSPEFFMKKLLAQGYKNIFQICKAFRNNYESSSPFHNPEFTILEWYRTNADYTDIMVDCEKLVNFIYRNVFTVCHSELDSESPWILEFRRGCRNEFGMTKKGVKNNVLSYQNRQINISLPWLRLSVREAFRKYANINLDQFLILKVAKKIAKEKGYQIGKNTTWEQIYHQIFLNEIEPKINNINQPVILYDYPTPLAALSKRKKSDSRYAERFELYIAGLELGNAFSELTDWQEQEQRLKNDLRERKRLKIKVFDYDHDFIDSLKKGFPKTGGIAIGIDRLVMLFTKAKSINEVIFFPAGRIFSKS